MTDFERDVIDRLARMEENGKTTANLSAVVLAQGLRIDALEDRLNRFKDRMWGVTLLSLFLGVPLVTYLRVQMFGMFGMH